MSERPSLGEAGLARAREFVMTSARPLDRARWLHLVEGGPAAPVVEELEAFQNDDGGFGHGLEPDFRTAASSALATTVAFQVLRELSPGEGAEVAARAVSWLLAARDADTGGWSAVPPEVEDAPHAPWWAHGPAPSAASDPGAWANPGLEIAGILHAWPAGVSEAARESVTADALATLGALPEAEMHALLCALRFVEDAPAAAEPHRGKVEAACLAVVPGDPAKWTGYGPRPLWYAPAPDSPGAKPLAKRVEDHLDIVVGEQTAEGSWDPFWTWGEPSAGWDSARADWRGWLTVNTVVSLRAWRRLGN